jgi:glycosyltransferase involved in cell wall biosynthesis
MHPTDLVHFHASRLSVFLLLNLPLLIAGHDDRRIVTLHSGEMPADLRKRGLLSRFALRSVLKRYGVVIAVSRQLSDAIAPYLTSRQKLVTVPAFIAQDPSACAGKARESHNACPARAGVTVVCSGYGTRIYNWEEVLSAVVDSPPSWCWHCCFYNTFERPYYNEIRSALDRLPNVTCHENLESDEFLSILKDATVFLRPTRTDGDAVSVREALALGIPCVASSVVPRPEGVIVYELGNTSSLCNALQSAVTRPAEPHPVSDFGPTILGIYESVRTAAVPGFKSGI